MSDNIQDYLARKTELRTIQRSNRSVNRSLTTQIMASTMVPDKIPPRFFCSQLYPQGIKRSDYEVFAIDNGSTTTRVAQSATTRRFRSRSRSPARSKANVAVDDCDTSVQDVDGSKKILTKTEQDQSSDNFTSMANTLCVICYCRLCDSVSTKSSEKSKILALSCLHTFHSQCLSRWMEIQKFCPICRNAPWQ